jgi:hypothetical protein
MTPRPITTANHPVRSEPVPLASMGSNSVDPHRHRRHDFFRAIQRYAIVGALAFLILLSIPGLRSLQSVFWIQSRGCRVDWQFDVENWWYGGTSVVMDVGNWSSQIGDQDLLLLQHLPRIHSLALTDSQKITDDGLGALRSLPYLTDLDLSRLARFRSREFDTGNPPLTDACLAYIEPLQKLEFLALSGNDITDAGLAHIAKLPALRSLDLDATEITDAGLPLLQGMSSLKTVSLSATRLSAGALTKLQNARPDLNIGVDTDPMIKEGVERIRGANR